MKEHPITRVSSKIVYENPWVKIHEDETIRYGDQPGIYGYMESRDSVVVCALNASREIYLVYGYSYPTDTWSWQLPGGGGDNESPEVAAKRELKEETGLKTKYLKKLGQLIVCTGLLTEKMAVVAATDCVEGKRPEADDKDLVHEGKFVSFSELEKMVAAGEVCDSQSLSAIYLAEKFLQELGDK